MRGFGSRRNPTSTATKCPQYAGRTVAVTVALEGGRRGHRLRATRQGRANLRLAQFGGNRATILGISGRVAGIRFPIRTDRPGAKFSEPVADREVAS
jgi:hypothetical protein